MYGSPLSREKAMQLIQRTTRSNFGTLALVTESLPPTKFVKPISIIDYVKGEMPIVYNNLQEPGKSVYHPYFNAIERQTIGYAVLLDLMASFRKEKNEPAINFMLQQRYLYAYSVLWFDPAHDMLTNIDQNLVSKYSSQAENVAAALSQGSALTRSVIAPLASFMLCASDQLVALGGPTINNQKREFINDITSQN